MHNPASATNGLKGGRPQKYDRAQIIALRYEQRPDSCSAPL